MGFYKRKANRSDRLKAPRQEKVTCLMNTPFLIEMHEDAPRVRL